MPARFRTDRLIRARLFRRLLKGDPVEVIWRGERTTAEPGDYVDCEVLRGMRINHRFGPTIFEAGLARKLGEEFIDDSQVVLRPGAVIEYDADAVSFDPAEEIRVEVGDPANPESLEGEFVVVHPDAVMGLGLGRSVTALTSIARHYGLRLLHGISNKSEPCALPLFGEPGSPHLKLPMGRSVFELGEALYQSGLDVALGVVPRQAPIAYWNLNGGEGVGVTGRVYGWEPSSRKADTKGVGREDWAGVVSYSRKITAGLPDARPPVGIYSTTTGPWGGVKVLLRLVDELQRRGVHAKLVHRSTIPHPFKTFTPPQKVRSKDQLAREWPQLVGEEALLIASHWGSSPTISAIMDQNPDVVPLCFMQDREDRFRPPKGRPVPHPSIFEKYLAIGRGVSVSGWVLETGEQDGLFKMESYSVIPPGLDLSIFKPSAGERNEGPPRILAMWRPQTAHRRGADILREAYAYAREQLGDTVSFEVFGWNGEGEDAAPDYVKHHGVLSEEGVARLMAEVDIVVEPSRFQGFGLPGAEAMACGACLVSTKCLGVREYAKHERNALVVDHDELGEAICRAARNPVLRENLAANAIRDIRKLSWAVVADQWIEYLAGLYLETHPQGRWAEAWKRIRDAAR